MPRHIPPRRVPRDRLENLADVIKPPSLPPAHTHVEADITDKPLTTDGDILYYNLGNQRLAASIDGKVLTLSSGLPSWGTASGLTVTVSTSAASGGGNDGDLWCRI